MDKTTDLIMDMIEFNSGYPDLIQHFIKVHQFAKVIGMVEGLNEDKMEILEAAAIVHDIGIKICLNKYGECTGELQEKEGPEYARELLNKNGFRQETVERICFLVAHHHTYTEIDDLDYQILIEADFLVNLYENSCDKKMILDTKEKHFETSAGRKILMQMFFEKQVQ